MAGEPRVRGVATEFPGVYRIREEISERRRPAVGGSHAHRPARWRRLGDQARGRRSEKNLHHGRKLWRVRDAGGSGFLSGCVLLRRGYCWAVEPEYASENDSAVLVDICGDLSSEDGRRRGVP